MKRTLLIDKSVTRGPVKRKDGMVVGPGEMRATHEKHSVFVELEQADALGIAREAAAMWLGLQEASREAVTDYYLANVGTLTPDEALTDEAFQAKLAEEREHLVAAGLSVLNDSLEALAKKWCVTRVALVKGGWLVEVPVSPEGRTQKYVFSAAELGV